MMIRLELSSGERRYSKRSIRFIRVVDYGWMEAILLTPETPMEARVGDDRLVNTNAADLEAIPADVVITNPQLTLPSKESMLGLRVKKKIPAEIIRNCWRIFNAGYQKDRNEWTCFVRLHQTDPDRWDIVIPRQHRTGAEVTVPARILEESVMQPGWWIVGNFHSHPFGGHGAFLSGTDRAYVDVLTSAVAGSFNFSPSMPTFGEMALQIAGFGEIDPRLVIDTVPPPGEEISAALPPDLQALFDAEANAPVLVLEDQRRGHHPQLPRDWTPERHSYIGTEKPAKTPSEEYRGSKKKKKKGSQMGIMDDLPRLSPSSVPQTTVGGISNAFEAPTPDKNLTLTVVEGAQ